MTPERKNTLTVLAGYYAAVITMGLLAGWAERWSHRPLAVNLSMGLAIFVIAPWLFHRRRMRDQAAE